MLEKLEDYLSNDYEVSVSDHRLDVKRKGYSFKIYEVMGSLTIQNLPHFESNYKLYRAHLLMNELEEEIKKFLSENPKTRVRFATGSIEIDRDNDRVNKIRFSSFRESIKRLDSLQKAIYVCFFVVFFATLGGSIMNLSSVNGDHILGIIDIFISLAFLAMLLFPFVDFFINNVYLRNRMQKRAN